MNQIKKSHETTLNLMSIYGQTCNKINTLQVTLNMKKFYEYIWTNEHDLDEYI